MSSSFWNKKNIKNTDKVVNINYLFYIFHIYQKSIITWDIYTSVSLSRTRMVANLELRNYTFNKLVQNYWFHITLCQCAMHKWEYDTSAACPLAFSYSFLCAWILSKERDWGPLRLVARLSVVVTEPPKDQSPSQRKFSHLPFVVEYCLCEVPYWLWDLTANVGSKMDF